MKTNLHILTGGSKGLGDGIAKALSEKGDQVVVLSRSAPPQRIGVKSIEIDLSELFEVSQLVKKIFLDVNLSKIKRINLINNAGMVDPISPATNILHKEMYQNLMLNLFAPMSLTAEFLRQTKNFEGQRMVMNISSGVAKNPKAFWSVYSAAKSGLESFTVAIEKEFSQNNKIRFITLDPGIMDTQMQAQIRSTPAQDFPDVAMFIDYKNSGKLLSPIRAGELVAQVISGELAKGKSQISMRELISENSESPK